MVVPGVYDIEKIDFFASNLCLHFERDVSQPLTTGGFLRSPRITIYHRTNTLDARLVTSNHIQLDKNNTVDIEFNSGWNELVSAEVRVKSATSGLRLLTAEAQCIRSSDTQYEFAKKPAAGLFAFEALPKHAALKIRFPYTVEQEVLNIVIRIEVSYKTEHGDFMFSTTPSVPISLALGVNVQDVFKHKALFSRFTVSTASHSPLRLFGSELISSDIFESSSGLAPEPAVIVFPKQPASLLYKITRKRNVKINKDTAKMMYLKLEYSVLQDEVADIITDSLATSLGDTPLHAYARLLGEAVVPHIRQDLGAHELEQATLLGRVSTDFLRDINWVKSFAGLGKSASGEDIPTSLSSFLKAWQSENRTLALPQSTPAEPRSILIPVDIPPVTIVHTVDIRLQPHASPTGLPSGDVMAVPTVTANQLVPGNLHLKWTRVWDTANRIEDMADLEFSYEVTAPGDAWIVGGRRKGHFVIPSPSHDDDLSSKAETEADIPLLLIPQREGYIPFPVVDIREIRLRTPEAGGSGTLSPVEGAGGEPCETDLKNLGETVRVIADRERVTVSLDSSGPSGGPLVLEAMKRGTMERVVA